MNLLAVKVFIVRRSLLNLKDQVRSSKIIKNNLGSDSKLELSKIKRTKSA